MTSVAARPAQKSRRWRHAEILFWLLALASPGALAGCPAGTDDGILIRQGELTLAWRPLLAADRPAPSNRIPMAKHFVLDVQLCDKDGISAAQLIKADASMPAHRHGMNYKPVIKPQGNARFRVEGMMFHMAGQWRLAFEVQSGKETLRLNHDVQAD
ncbi:MAG: hypothetical protein HZA62_10995 [Rhodocyclales bacterium]|nr:hypothetical protein [Rhodocyclales bacterium]